MMKKIAALAGDLVSYDMEEKVITVNGEYEFSTEVFSEDTSGRPLTPAVVPLYLKDGEAWLTSENIRGYDSRYFGPVSTDGLIRVVPVWLF
jgi:type IV secretory pathway protease TraF